MYFYLIILLLLLPGFPRISWNLVIVFASRYLYVVCWVDCCVNCKSLYIYIYIYIYIKILYQETLLNCFVCLSPKANWSQTPLKSLASELTALSSQRKQTHDLPYNLKSKALQTIFAIRKKPVTGSLGSLFE